VVTLRGFCEGSVRAIVRVAALARVLATVLAVTVAAVENAVAGLESWSYVSAGLWVSARHLYVLYVKRG
jgi:hypothetical protein